MSSDPSTWGGLQDVKFDDAAATALINRCHTVAGWIRDQMQHRTTLTTTAMEDFDGYFSGLFQDNQNQANADGREIADSLDDVATQIKAIQDLVPEENARRQEAREWKKRYDEDKSKLTAGDIFGDEDPPEGPKSPPTLPKLTAKAADRKTPRHGGGGKGRSSARPEALRSFVSGSAGKIDQLDGEAEKLRGLNDDFTAGFDWNIPGEASGVDGSAVYAALGKYNHLNREDQKWVRTVARMFEDAGGGSVSNAALTFALKQAGVTPSREDIPLASPRVYGIKPTTGYSDDPVNAFTGNFVEPESDLTFPGGCAALELTRMYNSFNRAGGAFGRGWSSWTETGLSIDDEAAHFTLPDGRVVEFPRLADGWDRARGESMWLARDEAADELRVCDNEGGVWRFSSGGLLRSHDRGEGTMVSLVYRDGRLVRMEHERGRSILLEWDGDHVVAAEASDGRRVVYGYDDEGQLHEVTGPLGTRTYRWSDAGFIEAVIDADGVVEVENTYDEQGRVTSQLSPHGRTSRYTYLPGNVTEVCDPDGSRSNTWVHDRRGRLLAIVDSEGNRQSTAYDNAGNPIMVTEADGSVTVREFDERGHLIRQVTPSGADLQFEYDDLDRLVTTVTEEGAVTACRYDGTDRNPSVIVDPEGGETRLEWSGNLLTRVADPTGVALRFGYNEHGDLISTTNANGDVARLEYDAGGNLVAAVTPSGRRTEFHYDEAGLLAERRDPDGAVWRFEYTTAGRRTAVVDPTGSRTAIEYGMAGEEVASIDPLGRATRQRMDDLGNVSSIELPDGSTWRYAYDGLSRPVSVTSPEGGTWASDYDAAGDVTRVMDPTGVALMVRTDRLSGTVTETVPGGKTVNRFDPLGRPLSSQGPDDSVVMATYDRCGRPVELLDGEGGLTRIERDAGGRPVAVTNPVGEVTRFEYDACGRRSAVIDPAGARTTWAYDADGRPDRVTLPTGEIGWMRYDAAGRATFVSIPGVGVSRYSYDAAGRVVEVKDSTNGLRRFSYDAAGQLVAATNGNGGVTRYEYDANGRCVGITDPLGHVTRREFNALDLCVSETDPLGRTRRAGYDQAGRQVWQENAAGNRAEWVYDADGQLVETRVNGELFSSITRDWRNRTVTVADHTRGDGRAVMLSEETNRRGQPVRRSRDDESMCWAYDPAGRRTSMTFADGQQIAYGYRAGGRLAFVEHPLLGRASFEYDAAGRITAANARGLTQSWSYADGFVAEHSVTDADSVRLTRIERDDDGRIIAIDRDGVRSLYSYDEACQLIEETILSRAIVAADAARPGSGSADGESRVRWRYDAAGRLVSESRTGVGDEAGTREFTYDAASQLVTETGPAGVTRHDYDAAGQRARTRFADGCVRELEWTPSGWLTEIVESTGDEVTRTRLRVDATGALTAVDEASVWWDTAMPYTPVLAQVGAVPVVPAGAVTAVGESWTAPGWRTVRAQHDDDPWRAAIGSPQSVGGVAGASVLPGVPDAVGIGAAGELALGGLEWLVARVYDPDTRGFLSVDPLDPVTGAGWAGNPYSYAGNDPLHALDPTGLKPVTQAELDAANRPWYEKAWDATTHFVAKNKDWIINGALVVGGIAAMAIPVVGPALGTGMIAAGADGLIQKAVTGSVNYKEVVVTGVLGVATAGAGSALAAGGTKIAASAAGKTAAWMAEHPRVVKLGADTVGGAITNDISVTAQDLMQGKAPGRDLVGATFGGAATGAMGNLGAHVPKVGGALTDFAAGSGGAGIQTAVNGGDPFSKASLVAEGTSGLVNTGGGQLHGLADKARTPIGSTEVPPASLIERGVINGHIIGVDATSQVAVANLTQ